MSNTVVQTNVLALNAHRNIGIVSNRQARGSQRLSSGFRINSAADDAAGLGISEKMRAQIRGLDQASRNGQDGISLIQTAEGAMSTINEMVVRIRELVVQASNDTNAHDSSGGAETLAQSDRMRIQDEIDQLLSEIDATRNRVEFNTRTLLNGSLDSAGGTWAAGAVAGLVGQMGDIGAVHGALNADQQNIIRDLISSNAGLFSSNNTEVITGAWVQSQLGTTQLNALMGADSMTVSVQQTGNVTIATFTVPGMTTSEVTGTNPATPTITGTLTVDSMGTATGGGGTVIVTAAGQQTVAATGGFTQTAAAVLANDIASWLNTIRENTATTHEPNLGTDLWFHVGANSNQGVNLNIADIGVGSLHNVGLSVVMQAVTRDIAASDGLSSVADLDASMFTFNSLRSNEAGGVRTGGVLRERGEEINLFLTSIDQALAHVTSQRSNLGAMQNRLEYTIENLDIASENLSAAESRIRDADMALEMMRFTQANVLQQAAMSMLAQANQAPMQVLQLLG